MQTRKPLCNRLQFAQCHQLPPLIGDSDTPPKNNTDSNGCCRGDEVFFYTFIYLLSISPLSSSRFLSQAERRCCHMLQHPDLRTCLQEQVILQALPRVLWGESHIPHRAQWGTPTTWARRDTFVPCLGKQESCTVPLQSCVPCKSRRMALKSAQSTTHCSHSAIIPKALCLLHPSWPLNSSPSLSNQHTLYFLKHSGFEHILLLCTNISLFFPCRWALTHPALPCTPLAPGHQCHLLSLSLQGPAPLLQPVLLTTCQRLIGKWVFWKSVVVPISVEIWILAPSMATRHKYVFENTGG